MADLPYYVGDTAPSIFGTLEVDGAPINLTGTSVKFQMRLSYDNRYAVDADAVIVTPAAGSVRYDWAEGDLDVPGTYVAHWAVTFGDGSVQHSVLGNSISVSLA